MRIAATPTTFLRAGLLGLTVLATASPAFAGPPLLCHPFDIGSARSLPWSGAASWYDRQAGYDIQRLVADTTAILTPAAPVLVRMETLRRAAIYAAGDPQVAKRLFLAFSSRIPADDTASPGHALALFDAGYLTETFREINRLASYHSDAFAISADTLAALVKDVDGYALVQKSLALRAGDPSIEFASALIATSTAGRKGPYAQHAAKARAGAATDPLLGRNLGQISN
ncbi:MAG: hypothetical protein ABJC51_05820 [Acidobacteriota bacterium]